MYEEGISDEKYEFAQTVWNKLNIKNLGEYSDLYLKTDVLLLADVFENFRKTRKQIYKLDPARYYTAPGLSFDAMLRYTNVELELITDVDMLLFVERGIRGGISQCSKRYVAANNIDAPNHDKTKDSNYIMYYDANNLYGFSMMQYLPQSKYMWCNEQFDKDKILNIPDDAFTGYIFEVDLDYPEHLHDSHNDYPFCGENMSVPGSINSKKLLLTLYNKRLYNKFSFSLLKNVLISWEALVLYFMKYPKNADAVGFLRYLTSVNNLKLFAFLADVLFVYQRFQKMIQSDRLTIISLMSNIASLKKKLEKM